MFGSMGHASQHLRMDSSTSYLLSEPLPPFPGRRPSRMSPSTLSLGCASYELRLKGGLYQRPSRRVVSLSAWLLISFLLSVAIELTHGQNASDSRSDIDRC
jgi:hypothetical protein